MRIQTFEFGEFLDGLGGFSERGALVFYEARAALELIYRESGERSPRPTGGQRVARAGNVVTEDGRRVRTEKDRAGCEDVPADLFCLASHHLAMFGRKLICQREAIGNALHLNQPTTRTERTLDEFTSRELF